MFVELAQQAMREPPDKIVQEMQAPPTYCKGETWIVGLSLGQTTQASALALLRREKVERGGERRSYYGCQHLHRWPPGTDYETILKEVKELFADPRLQRQTLVLERTAVGEAVVRLFARIGAKLAVLSLSAASGALVDDKGGWVVGKTELVSTMQVLLSRQRFGNDGPLFRVAPLGELAQLLDMEWQTFSAQVQLTGGKVESAWRETVNEDLALAVSAGCWYGEMMRHTAVG